MSTDRTIYLFVNGVACWPGNFTNWNKRAVTFTHTRTPHRAEAFEYFCTPITRPFREDERAKHFARALREYGMKTGSGKQKAETARGDARPTDYRQDACGTGPSGTPTLLHSNTAPPWRIICVGHSNGAAVILDGLRRAEWPRVAALHLVCAACDADFARNGLNFALSFGHVGRVFVYCGEQDWALRCAHTLPGKLLGYGVLGLTGPQHVAPRVQERVGTLWWKQYGHSTCWLPEHFRQTMKHFLTTDESDAARYATQSSSSSSSSS